MANAEGQEPTRPEMETNGKAGAGRLGLAVHCPGCGAYFGRIVEHHGRPYLDDGHFLILTGIRHCHTCRRAFHWHGEKRRVGDWKDGRVEGWEDGRVEEWKDGRVDSRKLGNFEGS